MIIAGTNACGSFTTPVTYFDYQLRPYFKIFAPRYFNQIALLYVAPLNNFPCMTPTTPHSSSGRILWDWVMSWKNSTGSGWIQWSTVFLFCYLMLRICVWILTTFTLQLQFLLDTSFVVISTPYSTLQHDTLLCQLKACIQFLINILVKHRSLKNFGVIRSLRALVQIYDMKTLIVYSQVLPRWREISSKRTYQKRSGSF